MGSPSASHPIRWTHLHPHTHPYITTGTLASIVLVRQVNTIPELDVELGNPVMMARQKWAINMAKDRSLLPGDALGVGI